MASLTCVGELEARILLESALGQRLCSKGQLLGRLPGNRNARLRDMVDEASECADSPLETLARLALRNAGLTVRTQVHIPGVGRVDMVVEDQVVIELDGYQFHSSREAFANDRRRSNVLAARGTPCLRFTYDDVVHRPDELVQTTKATLASCRGR
ncbi:endonuclease domain-containing protein [Falsarthrobacter nasiphocae]|uniref:Very-short-patch-repair endonuclease n=1 Tax=Falsarthrobacter nasiphocae TaxID=189863 RepID=A0AAE4C6Q6_9MICC|nr:DUF559 domain-containing protein [Falsarthrobacter nasiphocae]MDR6891699.1 very-short-patch-repair endonuclease [Falsarthrobacter nasiphocae]